MMKTMDATDSKSGETKKGASRDQRRAEGGDVYICTQFREGKVVGG